MTLKKATSNSRESRAWPEVSAGLVGLVFLSYAWPVSEQGAWEAKSAVITMLTAVLASWAFAGRVSSSKMAISPVSIPLLALSGWMVVSVAWSPDRVAGFEQAMFFLWVAVLLSSPGVRPSAKVLSRLAIGLALVEAMAGTFLADGLPGGRLNGTFVGSNHHSALILCGFSVASVYAVSGKSFAISAGATALSFLFVASASMSGSRAVVPAVGAILAVLLIGRPGRFRFRRAMFLSLASVVALLAPNGVVVRIADQLAGREPLPLGRLDLWGDCLRMFGAHPLLGTGIGGFADSYFAFRPHSLEKVAAEFAHCEPLQLACETGLIGMVFLAWAVYYFWRSRPRFRGLAMPGAASFMPLVPLAVYSLVDYPMRSPVLAFIAVASLSGWGTRFIAIKPAGKWERNYPAAAFLLVSLAMAGWFSAGHIAGWKYAKGALLARDGNTAEAVKEFESALEVFPLHAESLLALAELDPDGKKSESRLSLAIALRPAWIPPIATSFERSIVGGDAQAAETAFKRAQKIDPRGLTTSLMGVRLGIMRRDLGFAGRWLADIDYLWPNNLDVLIEKARFYEAAGDIYMCRNTLNRIRKVFPRNIMVKAWLERLPR